VFSASLIWEERRWSKDRCLDYTHHAARQFQEMVPAYLLHFGELRPEALKKSCFK
jgi:hypothetical protein